jgi:hypothetical protein
MHLVPSLTRVLSKQAARREAFSPSCGRGLSVFSVGLASEKKRAGCEMKRKNLNLKLMS